MHYNLQGNYEKTILFNLIFDTKTEAIICINNFCKAGWCDKQFNMTLTKSSDTKTCSKCNMSTEIITKWGIKILPRGSKSEVTLMKRKKEKINVL